MGNAKKRFWKIVKSLKFRLILLFVILATVPGFILHVGILRSYESRAIAIRESEILSQAQILSNKIATSEYINGGSSETILEQINMLTTIYDGRAMLANRAFRIVLDTYNLDTRKTIISEEVILSYKGKVISKYDSENHYIEMTVPVINPEDETGKVLGVLLISVSTDNIELNRTYLAQRAWILEMVVGGVILFFGILISMQIIRPVNKVSDAIEAIQNGYGGDLLEVRECTETAQISDKFNDMLTQMRKVDSSREEFVSNVSHELKTPLTSMKVLADSINSMPDAPIELYQEFMGDITSEIERETTIINDLLTLVKMDKSAKDMNIVSLNINELVEKILKRLQPLADRNQVQVVLESFRPVTAEVDEVKLTLVITNLVENAIKYNRTDGEGWVHVSLNADYQYFYLKVEDSGMGIPEDSLDNIFERFYRVDKSHSREIGGTGLGLAITRSAILMHRGAIKVHSVLGEGTVFNVRIPLTYIV